MSAAWRIHWRGAAVRAAVEAAAIAAINETMGECVTMAKVLVRKKTTNLQGSLRLEPASRRGTSIVGTWGSFDVNYALWQEIGTSRMSAQPYLRPSGDTHYPKLSGRIKARVG